MRFQDAAKFVTETGQPPVFVVAEISKRWYDGLPADLQKILDENAMKEAVALHPHMVQIYNNARKAWTDNGGELVSCNYADANAYFDGSGNHSALLPAYRGL